MSRGLFRVSSMFTYCIEVLHLSEPEAYLRIQVGRTAPYLRTVDAGRATELDGIVDSRTPEETARPCRLDDDAVLTYLESSRWHQ
jgi:hypothetical protein